MSTQQELTLYGNAQRALAELVRVDEVKEIRDKVKAMEVYAQQAKDRTLLDRAIDVRERAEIRMGELLKEMSDQGLRAKAGDNQHNGAGSSATQLPPTLNDMGVSKTQSSRWQAKAALPADKREALIRRAKNRAAKTVDVPAARPPKPLPDALAVIGDDGVVIKYESIPTDDFGVYDLEGNVIGWGKKHPDGLIDIYLEPEPNAEKTYQPPRLAFKLRPADKTVDWEHNVHLAEKANRVGGSPTQVPDPDFEPNAEHQLDEGENLIADLLQATDIEELRADYEQSVSNLEDKFPNKAEAFQECADALDNLTLPDIPLVLPT